MENYYLYVLHFTTWFLSPALGSCLKLCSPSQAGSFLSVRNRNEENQFHLKKYKVTTC